MNRRGGRAGRPAGTGQRRGTADGPSASIVGHAARALVEVTAGWPDFELDFLAGDRADAPAAAQGQGDAGTANDAMPADRRLADYFRRHPALGRRDRRAVADRVFAVLRDARGLAAWLRAESGTGGRGSDRADDAGRLVALSAALAVAASDGPGAPSSPSTPSAPSADGLAAAYRDFTARLRPALRYGLPDWLWARIAAAWPARAAAIAEALQSPAPVALRCNLLKTRPAALAARLAADGIAARPVDWPAPPLPPWSGLPSTALRVEGRPALEQHPAFGEGWFELQDAGSQRIADACEVRRGEVVIDFCAGAGGKSLALAARMRDSGRLYAFDVDGARLDRLGPRAARAGVSIIVPMRIDGCDDPRLERYRGKADCVLVDAPCGGSGTLRRNPDLKWRYGPADIARFAALQRQVLAAAARLVRPGGRLVYATCSLLPDENERVARDFEDGWPRHGDGRPLRPLGAASLLPDAGGDGFFVAKWVLSSR